MNVHIFGSNSLLGLSYSNLLDKSGIYSNIFKYSSSKESKIYCDLRDKNTYKFLEKDSPSLIISFAPIWLFSKYINELFYKNCDIFSKVKGFIICSSSSSLTKRFSANEFDKNLSKKLSGAEESIIELTNNIDKRCIIIQPSLIYGNISKKKDKNISKIIQLIKFLPLVILPKDTGLRQPIHINQLASVFLHYSEEISNSRNFGKFHSTKKLVGGNEEISYYQMIKMVMANLKGKNITVNCKLITIPNRLFLFLFSPLIIFSPKWFSAIERISADLSNFEKVNKIIKGEIKSFPVEPFG